jgi:phosphoribosylamine---glycine ligase
VHHAGTAEKDGAVVTAGGRVLVITATGNRATEARARAYLAVNSIHFDGLHYRRDIGVPRA